MKDLAVIVADKNMNFALRGLLKNQAKSLGIREIEFEIEVHPERDPGVRTTGPSTLALLHREFHHGIIMLDWDGCGERKSTAEQLEGGLDAQLHPIWGDRAKSLVIDPEVDAWLWGNDHLLKNILGWPYNESIREWLRSQGFAFNGHGKPSKPKDAIEALVFKLKRARSSAIYESITGHIGLRRCTDPAFARLRSALQEWFSPG